MPLHCRLLAPFIAPRYILLMYHLVLLIAYFILTFNLAADQNVDLTAATIQRYLAKNPQNSINEWDARLQPATRELFEQLPFSEEANSTEEALTKVLSKLKQKPLTLKQKQINRENAPKQLFFAYERNQGVFTIKVYPQDSTLFLSDFWGQLCAHELNLTALKIPSIWTVGKMRVGGMAYFFLVEDYMPGRSFNELIESGESNLSGAFFLLGKGLKDYHARSSYVSEHLTAPFQAYVDVVISQGLPNIDAQDRSWLKLLIENLTKKVATKRLKASYVHADPNFGNFLLDEGQLALIDFEDSGKYIDAKKLGLGTPAYDLVTLFDYIHDLILQCKNLQEVELLKKAFLDGYGPLPYDAQEYLYFSIVDVLNAAVWFQSVREKLTEQRKAEVIMTIRRKLDKIKAFR